MEKRIFSLLAFSLGIVTAVLLIKTVTLAAPTLLPVPQGGTGTSTLVKGDILVASTTKTFFSLPIGASGLSLSVQNGLPAWGATTSIFINVSSTQLSLSSDLYVTGTSTFATTTAASSTIGTLNVTTCNGCTAGAGLASLAGNNTFTGMNIFGNVTSTILSAYSAYFGATATATFSNTGLLTLPSGFISNASSSIGAKLEVNGIIDAFGGELSRASSTFKGLEIGPNNLNVSSTLYIGDPLQSGNAYIKNPSSANIFFYNNVSDGITIASQQVSFTLAGTSMYIADTAAWRPGGTDVSRDLGYQTVRWKNLWIRDIYVNNGAIYTSNGNLGGTITSTLSASALTVASTTGKALGIFSVDSSGNTSASGTLNSYGLGTFLSGFISSASSSVSAGLQIAGALNASSTLLVNNLSTLTGGFISSASSTIAAGLHVAGNLSVSSTLTAMNATSSFTSIVFPSHSLDPITSSTVLNFFNTNDQATNFEKMTMGWISNTFFIQNFKGGSGGNRNLKIGSTSRTLTFDDAATSAGSFFLFQHSSGSATDTLRVHTNYTNSSGNAIETFIFPNLTQTGSAGYEGLIVIPNENTLGTGIKNIVRFGTSTSPNLFRVDNIGNIYSSTGTLSVGVVNTTFNQGQFLVDNTGNISSSGTLFVVSSSTFGSRTVTTTVMSLAVNGSTKLILPENTSALANVCVDANGNIYKDSSLGCLTSNPNSKMNIESLKMNALSTVILLNPIEWNWKPNQGRTGHDIGFNADEAAEVDKRLVAFNADGSVKGFKYQEFTAVLTLALQQQQKQFVEYREQTDLKIKELIDRLDKLEKNPKIVEKHFWKDVEDWLENLFY